MELRKYIKTDKKQMNMLEGSLADKILFFALPFAASSILQQLFNAVDIAVVGRFASSKAQAAVGCNGPVINLLLNLFIGISVGTNVVISSLIGQKQREKVKHAVHTGMTMALISGIFLMIIGFLISKPALLLLKPPEDLVEQAVLYLRIYFLGMPFIMIYNFGAAILRSVGDTKRPLYCLVLSGCINAGLNMLLVIVFHMDVAGVAIATDISNLISAAMVVYFLLHEKGELKLEISKLKISKPLLAQMVKIGLPAGLQSSVFSIANAYIQSKLNQYGTSAIAGSTVALNFEFFSYFIVLAFNQAAVTFTSQNYGAKQYERCKKIFRLCMMMSMVGSVVITTCFVLGRGFFIGIFNSDPEVIHYASIRMLHLLPFYFLLPSYEVGGAALRGIGHSMVPALLTVLGTCVLRIVWINTVCRKYTGFETLMDVYPVSWLVTGILVLVTYFWISRKVFSEKV